MNTIHREISSEIAEAAVAEVRKSIEDVGVPDIVSVHFGLKWKKGESLGLPAVIVWVKNKLPESKIPVRERLKKTVTVRLGGVSTRLPVDVQSAPRKGEPQPVDNDWNRHSSERYASTKARFFVEGEPVTFYGTLGAVFPDSHGPGWLATTAGHAVGPEGSTVNMRTWAGGSAGNVPVIINGLDFGLDLALLGPIGPTIAGRAATPIAGLGEPNAVSVSSGDWVLISNKFQVYPAIIQDLVSGPVTLDYGPVNLDVGSFFTVTPNLTQKGDSGGPAFDRFGRVVGFVMGRWMMDGIKKTFLVSARRGIYELLARI